MTTATVLPDLAVRFAATMADTFETGKVEELTSEEVSSAISICRFLRDLFAQARRSLEAVLSQGVDAKGFAAKYERAVTDLDAVLMMVEHIVVKARTNSLAPLAEEFVSSYRASGEDMLSLRQFLAAVLAKATTPARPVDWQRVQDAEAAYARGETKPFPQSAKD